ncbi:MAG: hypothetical protein ABIN93_05660 [Ginsengibacter sp.]
MTKPDSLKRPQEALKEVVFKNILQQEILIPGGCIHRHSCHSSTYYFSNFNLQPGQYIPAAFTR